ncbi:serine hydrolase domain-containing protein [Bosea vaviloviae]|uniref:Beta-lactamase-related domain-containing protein n=1 Tax=Bosea vaviloviae TaxID=1526658 RepID=A0A0N1F6F8_9HYPH|nr:serine hydrolase domain-containing protein [Bosea vaviloviae]KPH81731.1 hypothetical protein AE618_08435 [Bosea vaviloviae]
MRPKSGCPSFAAVLLCLVGAGSAHAQALPATPSASVQPGGPPPAAIALPETPDAFGVVVEEFAARDGLRRGLVIVRRAGKVVYEHGFGGDDPKRPHHLASLSKSITAACVATLVRDGKLAFDTTLRLALAKHFAGTGAVSDPRLLDVTIRQLLTHRSGLAGNRGDGEASTGRKLLDIILKDGAGADASRPLLRLALGQGLKRAPGAYQYSNDGYLALGAVVEEATGQPYETACRERVLAPAGAAGSLAKEWAIMGAYGGWSMTGADYLATLEAITTSDRIIGATARSWQENGADQAPAARTSWYGLGLRVRRVANGFNHWHWGEWSTWYRRAGGSRQKADFNTFATHVGASGTSWFVSFEPRLNEETRIKLDRELWRAFNAVKRWDPS